MTEKTKKEGCGRCCAFIVLAVIGFSVLGFIFRDEIRDQVNELSSNSSENDIDRSSEEPTTDDLVTLRNFDYGAEDTYSSESSKERDYDSNERIDKRILQTLQTNKTETTTRTPDYSEAYEIDSTEAETTTESMTTTTHRSVENATMLHEGSGIGNGKHKGTLSDDEDYDLEGST